MPKKRFESFKKRVRCMECPNCGAKVPDNAVFCAKCGRPLSSGSPAARRYHRVEDSIFPPDTPDADTDAYRPLLTGDMGWPEESKLLQRTHSPSVTIAAAVVVIAIIVVLLLALLGPRLGLMGSRTTSTASSQTTTSSAETDTDTGRTLAPADVQLASILQSDWFRINLPAGMAGNVRVYYEGGSSNAMVLTTRDGIALVKVYTAGALTVDDEAKVQVYPVGTSYDASSSRRVYASFYYQSNSGGSVARYGDNSAKNLTLTSSFNMSSSDFLACIELKNGGDSWAAYGSNAASASAASTASAASSTSSVSGSMGTTPFYGIFIGSYQERSNADSAAQKARSKGLDNVSVVLSTDWENLNSDPYYVVTVGAYQSRSDAQSALAHVQDVTGDPDAYVLYSGSHK